MEMEVQYPVGPHGHHPSESEGSMCIALLVPGGGSILAPCYALLMLVLGYRGVELCLVSPRSSLLLPDSVELQLPPGSADTMPSLTTSLPLGEDGSSISSSTLLAPPQWVNQSTD